MDQTTKSKDCRNRRAFLRGMAAVAAMPALPALPMPVLRGALLPATLEAQQTLPAPSPDVATLAQLVRLRFGNYLEDRDLPVLERGLERISRSRAELLKVKISNSDAPDCLFRPDAF